jgi:hypothetical protein
VIDTEAWTQWVILELMGHRKVAGRVTECTIAGHGLLCLDIPSDEPGGIFATQFYSPTAVYCITPVSEATARAFARHSRPVPVTLYELEPRPPFEPRVADDEDLDL